ncbi:MAG: acyloxyacyl hydrolase [Phycisphaerales bacterium]|nr:acyloxyacyl hydrolase [Phycisphaerales bacterium]
MNEKRHTRSCAAGLAVIAGAAAGALVGVADAGGPTRAQGIDLRLNYTPVMSPAGAAGGGEPAPAREGTGGRGEAQGGGAARWGEADGRWWVGITAAGTFAGTGRSYGPEVSFGTFVARDFQFIGWVAGAYYDQDGRDAVGGGPGIAFRWHFLSPDTFREQKTGDRSWTVYGDAGIGLLFSGREVPDGGTRFNFTPRAGVGSTIQLGNSPVRLDVGLRWAHISNANTQGSDRNPSRDSIGVYIGVLFPF